MAAAGGCCLHAQADKAPPYFHHQAWSTEDGLPQASVHTLLQSRDGYLWVGTEGGLARFDGQSFRVLNHETIAAFTSDDVSCLAEDGNGDLWVGTSDGLIRKQGEQYRRFSRREGLPADEVVALAMQGGDLLVTTAAGPAVWRHGHFEAAVATGKQSPGSAAMGTGKQVLWTFGTNDVQLSSPLQKKTWRIGRELPGSRVQALYMDGAGGAWVGTNRGLVHLRADGKSEVETIDVFRGESVLSLLGDREGDLWVGTEASGLHALQPRKFAVDAGSSAEAVTTVVRDRHGDIYYGTRDDGLFQIGEPARPVAAGKLTSPVILSLAAGRDGELWAGTPDGLNRIVDGKVSHWTLADGLPDNFVRSVAADADGAVWAGTRFGLVRIGKEGRIRVYGRADGLPSESIGPLLEVSGNGGAGVLWVGTSAGLCRQDQERFRCVPSVPQGQTSILTALSAGSDGSVWAGVHTQGLALAGDAGMMTVRSTALPKEIIGIVRDQTGSLWLRSTRGLYRVAEWEVRACVAGKLPCSRLKVDMYGRSDGMQSDEVAGEGNVPVAEGQGGELWLATRRGLVTTDAEHLLANRVPPGVAMTEVDVDGVKLASNVTPNVPVDVSPGHRQYSFAYAGLSLNNAGRIHYRYMLEGFDRTWVDAGTRRTAYYTNLPARSYRFRVMAANGDGVWSREEANFAFHVLAPWYRSVWAYLLAGCVAGLAVLALVQLRVRAETRHFALVLEERNRVAREVHDTLAQELVSVSLQVELAAQHAKAGRTEAVAEQLMETRALVRQALASARQSIWNLRANLSEESLPVRLTTRVDAARAQGVAAHVRIGGEYRRATPARENELMRIASEAILNVERHARATEMCVSLEYGRESLTLKVEDDGCGFDYAASRAASGHYGLQGLQERAAVLGGRVDVESAPGQGTTVTLTIPLPEEKA